ncbi:MAG: hypothetical protein PVJ43_06505 [Gemmatimonadales bacterium]
MKILPTVRNIVVLLVLLTTGILGLVDAQESAGYATTRAQGVATVMQAAYSFLGLLGFFAVVLRARLAVWVLTLWAITASATAGLASVVWGDAGLGSGLVAAGGAGVFTGLIVWAGARAVAPVDTD